MSADLQAVAQEDGKHDDNNNDDDDGGENDPLPRTNTPPVSEQNGGKDLNQESAEEENSQNQHNHHHHEDDEEDECRVCRGPAEEGRPLFKPCKCSGSIGLTHQDCLTSWLAVQRGDGRCELCKTKFRFAPQYAPNAPEHLPAMQVLSGLLRRFVAKWLPLTVRCVFAASLWLVAAPLGTAYLYQGWMHGPGQVMERCWSWTLVKGDLVSGAVVAACIIVSFLSIMSFADFLRVEWQQRGGIPGERGRERQRRHQQQHGQANQLNREETEEQISEPLEGDVDDGLCELYRKLLDEKLKAAEVAAAATNETNAESTSDAGNALRERSMMEALEGQLRRMDEEPQERPRGHRNNDDDDDDSDGSWNGEVDHDDDDGDDADHRGGDGLHLLMDDLAGGEPRAGQGAAADDDNANNRRANNNNNNNNIRDQVQQMRDDDAGNDRAFDMDQDEAVDLDINIALDELLGVRGPLSAVVRNLLWLLAFNAVYLFFFAFTPRLVGSAVGSIFFNSTALSANATNATSNATDIEVNVTESQNTTSLAHNITDQSSWMEILLAVESESERLNTTFRLPDVATVTLGYLSCAFVVVCLALTWNMMKKTGFFRSGRNGGLNENELEEMREALDEMNRLVHGLGQELGVGVDGAADIHAVQLPVAIGIALDTMLAIVKVAVLLFLKMFLLPIVLGLCLDASTIDLFRSSLKERVLYAGADLFSFILLHWVAGITFMLLVTVSVLQLREVAHPDLLAQMIRPQEPQPDLLGNLMHETVGTHTKRMVLSLAIYAVLLTMHVYLPVRIALWTGTTQYLTFLDLKFWYVIMPQLQVPLELLFFHLCMLALLEKYKNSIGEMQHHWLKLMSRIMNITECLLPQTVENFRLVGSRKVFTDEKEPDPFWFELAEARTSRNEREKLVDSNMESFAPYVTDVVNSGETKTDGARVLRFGSDYIRIPKKPSSGSHTLSSESFLLPTKIGRYRLKRDLFNNSDPVIQLWEEEPGAPIPRPPEGWDDLGAGGADVQGRWAWGREKKSTIERGVARRKSFFKAEQSLSTLLVVSMKLVTLLIFSWLATTILLCVALAAPLAIGRLLYFLLRVPERWIHDPLAFALGSLVFFPFVRTVASSVVGGDCPPWERLLRWIRRFHMPPIPKLNVLFLSGCFWFGVAPFLLGSVYEIAFIKTTAWFMGEEKWIDSKSAFMSWATGTVVLYFWAQLCIAGILTRRFWVFVFEGAVAGEEQNEGNAQGAAWNNAVENRQRLVWQGKHGRMARFFEHWKAILTDWEWDKVDPNVLLFDSAIPVVTELSYILFSPLACLGLCLLRIPIAGFARTVFVRAVLGVACCAHVSLIWKEQIMTWFEVAHRAARDDRYLIGEVLINYEQE